MTVSKQQHISKTHIHIHLPETQIATPYATDTIRTLLSDYVNTLRAPPCRIGCISGGGAAHGRGTPDWQIRDRVHA